jgi:hypothetical protein
MHNRYERVDHTNQNDKTCSRESREGRAITGFIAGLDGATIRKLKFGLPLKEVKSARGFRKDRLARSEAKIFAEPPLLVAFSPHECASFFAAAGYEPL